MQPQHIYFLTCVFCVKIGDITLTRLFVSQQHIFFPVCVYLLKTATNKLGFHKEETSLVLYYTVQNFLTFKTYSNIHEGFV